MFPPSLNNHKHQQNLLETQELAPKKSQPSQFLTLRKKLIFGYILVGIIPTVGTVTGLMVGNYYQKESTQTLTITYQEQKLLHDLQMTILQNRPAKELAPFVEDPVAFQNASDKMFARIRHAENLADQLKTAKIQAIADFIPQLEEYRKTLATFSQELTVLLQESQSLQTNEPLKQRILALSTGKSFSDLIQFSDQIDGVAIAVDRETRTAQDQLQTAETLRIQIVLGSLVVSIIIATLLSVIMGLAITSPLESLTQVAQKVTRDANIDLRATVSSRDEVGTLAHALNQLLDWVGIYTRELKDTQLHLIQAEKMSSLGQLVAGIAHEINNPVNFIHGNVAHIHQYTHDLLKVIEAYQTHYPEPPETLQEILEEVDYDFVNEDLTKLLQSIQVGTERIRQIVLSLRNFSRLDEADFKTVDIHEGIDNTLLILQHRLKEKREFPGVQIVKNYSQLPLVECYPAQLNQVFMNLLTNAIDALQESPQPQMESDRQVHPGKICISTQVMGENLVQIAIVDNGSGIPDDVRSRIFDPFFTTKPVNKGTGLGLSISYQIVTETHRGKIWCDATPGEGTTFVVEIPIHQLEPVSTGES
jgi:two-component system, NtrC family, sensor kinase